MTQRVLKPWWRWTYQNFAVKRASARVIPWWVTSWEVWFGGAKSGQYCVIGGGSLQMVSEPLPSLKWWERAQAQWGTLVGTLGPKMGWLWCPTLPVNGNEDVLICKNASFMTQRVLKSWWRWTYQNSAVKRASARVIPGWVTAWDVWFGGAKSGQYCVIGGGSLQLVSLGLAIRVSGSGSCRPGWPDYIIGSDTNPTRLLIGSDTITRTRPSCEPGYTTRTR